jgi:hypothetical protein
VRPQDELATLKIFKQMLRNATGRDVFKQFANIQIFGLLSQDNVLNKACYQRLKECLLNASDQVQ